MRRVVLWGLSIWYCVASGASGQMPKPVIPHNQSQVPNEPRSPAEAIRHMVVPEGFQVELVAAEPDIVNPVAMTFDERGRIWITESLEYPRSSAGPGQDRVKILEDTTGDGRADRVTIFADGLNIPSGIAVGYGGVWVANAPDLLFMQDTDGDGRADTREVVLTGFGRSDTHELPNSLTWGPDGWLYGFNGVFNHSKITHQGKTHEFTCALFRVHPRTRAFELFAEGTSNPWGVAFDPEGSAFVSACVIDHLWHLVETGYYHRQAGAYPPFTWKIESIVDHKHQKAAYCGLTYFDSPAYPAEYRDRLYMGNIHGGCINSDALERRGATYRAVERPDLLTANDAWFMPVAQKTGPDGSLYILDWYDRYHCYQDARRDPAGIDRLRGRLYRIRYGQTPRVGPFDLTHESDESLVEMLASPNVYERETAQRLLAERGLPATMRLLKARALAPDFPRKGRLHALFALVSADAVADDSAFLNQLALDDDATFRAWSVRAGGAPLARKLAGDDAPEVLLQRAIVAGRTGDVSTLYDLAKRAGDDPLLGRIVWKNLSPLLDQQGGALIAAFDRAEALASPAARQIVVRAWDRILATSPDETPSLLEAMLGSTVLHREVGSDLLAGVTTRIQSGEYPRPKVNAWRDRLAAALASRSEAGEQAAVLLAATLGEPTGLDAAHALAIDERGSDALRSRAFQALAFARDPRLTDLVHQTLPDGGASFELRRALINALARDGSDATGRLLVEQLEHLDPDLQPLAIEVLTDRLSWSTQLVTAIESKALPRELVQVNQLRKLLASSDEGFRARVTALWGTVRLERSPAREQVVSQMRTLLREQPGDPHRGVLVFHRVCGQCHKIYGQGQDVGPDITVNGRASFEQLLSNVFDPSLVIGSAYQARLIVTSDGRTLTGLVVEESPQRVVLKTQGGKLETVPRGDIDEMEVSKLSLMPEGLEKQLKPEELADLFAYLRLDKPPTDPTARPIPDIKK